MLGRRELHRHLRGAVLLATTAIDGAARRLDPTTDLHLRYDRVAPDGRWERIRFDLRTDRRAVPDGVTVDGNGRVAVHEALQHLLTRHHATPLLALRQQLRDATGAEVRSLSRALVGPFWYAGVVLPAGVPPVLGTGLALHGTREVVGVEVRAAGHRDPRYSRRPGSGRRWSRSGRRDPVGCDGQVGARVGLVPGGRMAFEALQRTLTRDEGIVLVTLARALVQADG